MSNTSFPKIIDSGWPYITYACEQVAVTSKNILYSNTIAPIIDLIQKKNSKVSKYTAHI